MNKDVFRKLRQMLMEELDLSRELSDKEMRELLVYVTCEPDFQVNDYREMIFLYGFYHHLS